MFYGLLKRSEFLIYNGNIYVLFLSVLLIHTKYSHVDADGTKPCCSLYTVSVFICLIVLDMIVFFLGTTVVLFVVED